VRSRRQWGYSCRNLAAVGGEPSSSSPTTTVRAAAKKAAQCGSLWQADTLLSALIVRGKIAETANTVFKVTHPYIDGIQVGVRGIAEKTGGDFIHSEDRALHFQASMRHIRARYTLYYPMPAGAEPASRVRSGLSFRQQRHNAILRHVSLLAPAMS
jgi:hypothetical protein